MIRIDNIPRRLFRCRSCAAWFRSWYDYDGCGKPRCQYYYHHGEHPRIMPESWKD
jgi:hypothetical protein